MRLLVLFVALFGLMSVARAQSVHWENSDGGDASELQLIFQDCAPDGDPQLPRMEGVTVALVGSSTQATLNNFSLSRSTILTYRARSQRGGTLQIPAFTVQTNKGSVRVPAFSGAATRSAAEANVFSRLEPGSRTVWAGEVFPLTYVLDVSRRAFNQLGTNIEWNAAPLVVEDWSKFEPSEAMTNGEARLNITSKTRAYVKAPGALTLNAANQLVNLQSGSIGFGLFQTPRIEQLSVTSDRPSLMVRALPPAPAGFNGAVGRFKLTSKVVPTSAAVGEPVTWTLELTGTGNWPDVPGLPQREVSKDFNVVQPQARRTSADGKLFDATLSEDVVLVPTKPGDYTVGPLNFVYFDPEAGSYQTIAAPRTRISVTPPPPAPGGTASGPAAAPSAETAAPGATTGFAKPAVPGAPGAIPRDPLSGGNSILVPLRESNVVKLVFLPFLFPPLYWAWLAVRRARQTDPLRPRREARDRLAAVIAQIRGEQTAVRPELLLQWEHATALLWNLSQAAPSASAFTSGAVGPASRTAPAAEPATPRTEWARLWNEADRALYSGDPRLPADWPDRAQAALAAKTVPGFRAWTAFLPHNLLPFVASLALLAAAAPWLHAEAAEPTGKIDAAAAYRRGDFAAAGRQWAATVASRPTDAVARHNLSLALAQQDRWAEAAAHAAAAVVQAPGNPAIRAQLALACEKAGYVPGPLAGFLPPGPIQSLAGSASPATWQLSLLLASVLGAAALALLLRAAYVATSVWLRRAALVTLVAASLLGLAGTASLLAYGSLANRDAVVAWRAGTLYSVPTEADTTQKTTALPAGSVAIADHGFLGWARLRFDNGQTGWVRKADLVSIWK